MKLILTDKYVCEVDEMNWTLKKVEIVPEYTKNGKTYPEHENESVIGYYKGFDDVVKAMLKHNQDTAKMDEIIALKDYADHVTTCNYEMLNQFKKVGAWVQKG